MPARQAVQTQTEAEADTDDLRGTIAAAIESVSAPEAAAPDSSAPEPESSAPPPEGSDVPASATEPGAETVAPEDAKTEGDEKPAQAEGEKIEPPSNWSKADKERFQEWPAPAQKQFMERFKAQEADYTRKTMEIAEIKREYEPIDQMFAPFKAMLRQTGRTPSSVIVGWANAERALSNPATRDDAFLSLARGYNVDLSKLAGVTSSQPQQPIDPANMTEQEQLNALLNPYLKQALTPYEQKVQQLEQQLQQAQQFQHGAVNAQRQQIYQAVTSEIENFANAKDAKGVLLHPYFSDVENDMTAIMAGYHAQGRSLTLDEAYNLAVRANPSTLERITAQQMKAAEASRTQEARAKSAQARRAGSSVVGTPGTGQPFVHANGDGRDLSLRETIQAALETSRV